MRRRKWAINIYILLTVKQLSPGHHAVGLPVQFRVNLYILGEKMSWLGHGKLTIEHRSQWGCHGDATRNKNGIKQNQVRINARVGNLSPREYIMETPEEATTGSI